MADIGMQNLLNGYGAAQQARAEADLARQRAAIEEQRTSDAERRASDAEARASRVSTDADLKRRTKEAIAGKLNALDDVDRLEKALADRDAIITEWMHSNEAFKRLARQYGKKLGVTDEQRQNDFDENILDVAEENPTFANTKKSAGAKTRLGKT